ncbi:hypothetical protein P152DRAFT_452429 [Eremomyces bilateralis CBS 781.70]|uniref:FMR1-interacting protein 1 conserved domain-containing protein n=1 Tax=Eremomyces bilateralis CBS 781.70 TaxID=1392243 RepID=A0A6G1FT19_9PEZI|nr:uncharacterized protein P152DRAFT_452429 [Eremomyces bilateralis CBS 781.70]KAF1808937.1 hypothetical protein P152DRAFT_452429 [Eremomyces bilateralis CBS 781.70]
MSSQGSGRGFAFPPPPPPPPKAATDYDTTNDSPYPSQGNPGNDGQQGGFSNARGRGRGRGSGRGRGRGFHNASSGPRNVPPRVYPRGGMSRGGYTADPRPSRGRSLNQNGARNGDSERQSYGQYQNASQTGPIPPTPSPAAPSNQGNSGVDMQQALSTMMAAQANGNMFQGCSPQQIMQMAQNMTNAIQAQAMVALSPVDPGSLNPPDTPQELNTSTFAHQQASGNDYQNPQRTNPSGAYQPAPHPRIQDVRSHFTNLSPSPQSRPPSTIHQHRPKPTAQPRVSAPPTIPSFGFDLNSLASPTQPTSSTASQGQKRKRKWKTNQLGLTPSGPERSPSPVLSEEDLDETEQVTRAQSMGNYRFLELKQMIGKRGDLSQWLEERKKKFPTKEKREKAEQERKERDEEYARVRQARMAHRQQALGNPAAGRKGVAPVPDEISRKPGLISYTSSEGTDSESVSSTSSYVSSDDSDSESDSEPEEVSVRQPVAAIATPMSTPEVRPGADHIGGLREQKKKQEPKSRPEGERGPPQLEKKRKRLRDILDERMEEDDMKAALDIIKLWGERDWVGLPGTNQSGSG